MSSVNNDGNKIIHPKDILGDEVRFFKEIYTSRNMEPNCAIFNEFFKVAEHSFSARFCWCNLARVQGFQKTNMPSIVLFFSITESSVLMALNFYYKDTLEKVTMQRTQQFSGFVCYRKNPIKCNACTVALKIENDYFSRNVPISNDPIVRISIHLAKK